MTGKRILLVEGIDDEHVFKHLASNRGFPDTVKVMSLGGVDPLLDDFPVRLKASEEGDIVGIIIDADTDIDARWASLRDRLKLAGYMEVPECPSADGTIVTPPADTLLPIVGIWIMPDNQTKGILEDFLKFLVPQDSLLFDHVKSSVAAIPADELRFGKLMEPKALIHTWLAWQESPGKPLGLAITARYLDANVPQVDVFIAWLNRLYFS